MTAQQIELPAPPPDQRGFFLRQTGCYNPPMSEPRKRRIVRRMLQAMLAVVLVCSAYVGSYWATCWLDSQGRSRFRPDTTSVIFEPIGEYVRARLPGSLEVVAVATWARNDFSLPLSEYYAMTKIVFRAGQRADRERLSQVDDDASR